MIRDNQTKLKFSKDGKFFTIKLNTGRIKMPIGKLPGLLACIICAGNFLNANDAVRNCSGDAINWQSFKEQWLCK